jgi:hypothetical protein
MADNGGGNAFLGFILGGVVVVVALIALAMYTGNFPGGGSKSQVSIELPKPTTTR